MLPGIYRDGARRAVCASIHKNNKARRHVQTPCKAYRRQMAPGQPDTDRGTDATGTAKPRPVAELAEIVEKLSRCTAGC